MKVTKERKLLLSVLAVGLAMLGYDRLQAGTTKPNEDDSAAIEVAEAAPPIQQSANETPRVADSPSLSQRLLAVSQGNGADSVCDPFSATGASPSGNSVNGNGAVAADETAFRASHHLSGVVVSGARSGVMLGGEFVRLGTTLDGWTLKSIARDSATFQSGARRITLSIER